MNFVRVTPFLHVPELERALAFFTGILGFEVTYRFGAGYAYVEREGIAFRLLESHDEDGLPPRPRRFATYVDVRDVDALHAELKPRLDTLPPGDVVGPLDQAYGQRELLVLGPDGGVIAFGQPIDEARARRAAAAHRDG